MAQKGHKFMKHTINFGQTQLVVSINRKRGRPGKSFLTELQKSFQKLIKLAQDKRYAGQPLSRILRVVFENKQTKKFLGLNLTAITFFTSVALPSFSPLNLQDEADVLQNPQIIQLTTESSVGLPLNSYQITQGYHAFHPAVDFNGILGEPVYPIMKGIVAQTVLGRFGYGNFIVIDHGSGFTSLYAHLAKIVVEENQEVDRNTVIGTVGATGWATGTHLHLEVHDNGRPLNPLTILK